MSYENGSLIITFLCVRKYVIHFYFDFCFIVQPYGLQITLSIMYVQLPFPDKKLPFSRDYCPTLWVRKRSLELESQDALLSNLHQLSLLKSLHLLLVVLSLLSCYGCWEWWFMMGYCTRNNSLYFYVITNKYFFKKLYFTTWSSPAGKELKMSCPCAQYKNPQRGVRVTEVDFSLWSYF